MPYLTQVNRGLVIGHIGGSNCIGFATGATALVKPSNVTYWRLGVNTGAWPNPHGMAPGFCDELVNVLGVSAPITIVIPAPTRPVSGGCQPGTLGQGDAWCVPR